MFDAILRIMATCDVVGSAKALATRGDVLHVPRGQNASGNQIRRLLKQHGVRVKDMFVLTTVNRVRLVVNDGAKAERVLARHGIDVA